MKVLKIGMRLGVGFGAVLLLLIVVAGLGINGMSRTKSALDEIVDSNVYKMNLVQDMSESTHCHACDPHDCALERPGGHRT